MFLSKLGLFQGKKRLIQPADYGLLKEMQRIGFQSFIMLRINEGTERRSHIVCETQNEAPRFVHEIVAGGLTAQHPLIYAIDKGLRLEAEAAADALFFWIIKEDSHYRVRVMRGVSAFDRTWSTFYVGYPALDIDFMTKTRDPADAKFDAVSEFMTGYVETAGNDVLRAALVEAFALGLAKAGGKIGREEEALRHVTRAREVQQSSTGLEGAGRALSLVMEGKPVPEDLSSYVGGAKVDCS